MTSKMYVKFCQCYTFDGLPLRTTVNWSFSWFIFVYKMSSYNIYVEKTTFLHHSGSEFLCLHGIIKQTKIKAEILYFCWSVEYRV